MKKAPNGNEIDRGYIAFFKLLRQNLFGHEFLFERIPQAFGYAGFVEGVADNIRGAKEFYDNALGNLRSYFTFRVKKLFVSEVKHPPVNQMSLYSVIQDWCESLDPQVFEQLFTDGTDRCLTLLRMVSNDEDTFVSRLAKATTGLRLEDWNDQTLEKCLSSLRGYKKNAEAFHEEIDKVGAPNIELESDSYQISFVSEDGPPEVKRFERFSISSRGKLLHNKIVADIDSFGQAITDAEKRQVLMDVLKKLC